MLAIVTRDTARSLRDFGTRLVQTTSSALERATHAAQKTAIATAPGKIGRTIVRSAPSNWTREVRSTWRKAGYLEFGTRRHVIEPRKGAVLRFVAGGGLVFARKVNHPGNKPYRFMRRGRTAGERVLIVFAAGPLV